MEKRIINIRFLFCIFVSLMLGILLSKFFLMDNGALIYGLLIALFFTLLAGLGYFYSYFTKEHNDMFRYRRKVSSVIKHSMVGCIISFFVGIVISIFPFNHILQLPTYVNDVTVSGVVSDYVRDSATNKSFLVDRVKIVSGDDLYNCNFKIRVFTASVADVQIGDVITFLSTLENYSYSDGSELGSLVDGIGYATYVNVGDLVVERGYCSVRENIKTNVKNILDKNLSQDNAGISYAFLFGGSNSVSSEVREMFSYAGISHILAVSGLHVGVIFSLIWFLLSLIKKPTHRKKREYPKLIIFALMILFYCYLCNFSVSVCRAALMVFLYALCNCLQIEYDSLSSLSLAGIVILLISPMKLFSLSFQLSFLCIFAIISFAPSLQRIFQKIKFPKWLAGALAVSIATNIAILPICLNSFNQVSLLGVIANLMVLPIFEVLYTLLFATIVISLIIPLFGVLLCIPNTFLHLIKVIVNYINQIPIGVFRAFNVGFVVLLFISILMLIIHYLLIRKKLKAIIVSCLSVVIVSLMVYFYLPNHYNLTNLIIHQQTKSNITFVINGNVVTMIGSSIDKYNCDLMCKKMKINKIDNIIAYDLQLNKLNELFQIASFNNVKNIYIPSNMNYNDIIDRFDNVVVFDDEASVGGVKYYFYNYLHKIIGTQFYVSGVGNVLIPSIYNNKEDNIYLSNECENFDYALLTKSNSSIEKIAGFADIIYFGNNDMICLEGN